MVFYRLWLRCCDYFAKKCVVILGMVNEGDLVDQYEIKRRISKGTFGELYIGRDIYNGMKYAIKVQSEKLDAGLQWEGEVLKQLTGGIYTPNYSSIGKYQNKDYLVMELLGDDMSISRQILRNNIQKYGYLYQLPISIHLTQQMINCVEYVHRKGFIHRDIKPANFVRRKGVDHTYCIVDFGIAKQHHDRDGIRPERSNAEFRGTTMFASVNTHEDKDQSYRDDLWSIIFSFVDILLGQLPWSEAGKKKEKLLVKESKKEYTTNVQEEKFTKWIVEQILTTESERDSPTQPTKVKEEDMSWNHLNDIFNHLNSLSYSDLPDYDMIRSSLDSILRSQHTNASIFPSLETILQEEIFINDESSTLQSSTPDWIFSEESINDTDPSTLQEIVIRRCNHLHSEITSSSLFNDMEAILDTSKFSSLTLTQLQSFPKIWISLVKSTLMLPEKDINWRTIQSLQTILKSVYWFYSYGSPPSSSSLPHDENTSNGESNGNLLMPWDEFMSLQKLIFDFTTIASRIRSHPDGPDGELVSFSYQQTQQKSRKRSRSDVNGEVKE